MSLNEKSIDTIHPYDDDIVKKFVIATIVWAGVAFLLGIVVAFQLANWRLNGSLSWLSFGRLRPLHTNAAIFAFAGNAIFAGIYYSTQRLCKTRLFSDALSAIHFWGWQAIIVSAALTLPFGISQSKEYAELEWPIDIAIAVVWVIFAVNFFGTLKRRREPHLYVALWFYIASILTVGALHVVNSIEIPVSFFQSYPVYAGVQDALVQWWYGHNAVAFVLTTPFLGLMYYFLPKAAQRPIFSYGLSIVHFWSLVFIYIWAGPHHLLHTALPDWAQVLGTAFSIMLWAPSWGGMVNGLMTYRGIKHRVSSEPTLKFMLAALIFYGIATVEGPLLSIKTFSAIGHYTDWIVGHVHGGTLGWNGFLTFSMLYFLVPKLWNTKLYSIRLANIHFWTGLVGILMYVGSMWFAGIKQGLMWQAIDDSGRLVYPVFIDTLTAIIPFYWVRAVGGTLYLLGFLVMAYNFFKTVQNAPAQESTKPVIAATSHSVATASLPFHRRLEGKPAIFTIIAFIGIAIGSVIEIIPTMTLHTYVNSPDKVDPWTPLEISGRDIYVKEGCYSCHSQMIRSIPSDVLRYGEASKAEDSMYDHPHQWGSKRTGPDLARVGGKYPHLWHFRHMADPRSTSPESIMPAYTWLFENNIDFNRLSKKLSVLKFLGVPYSDDEIKNAADLARTQAQKIVTDLNIELPPKNLESREIIALIAYLQRLGVKNVTPVKAEGTK
jgi:cytochrome c oxidase cbb3-type subunit I/II